MTSEYDVTEYGAEAGTDIEAGEGEGDTEAFQAAIDACADAGGGTVLVPPDDYETGTIRLRSHVTLHLQSGATVYASPDRDDYIDYGERPDGERVYLLAEGVENVTLEGRGEFNGRGTEIMRMDTPIQGHSGEAEEYPLITSGPHEARQGDAYLDRDEGTDLWPVAKPDFRPGPMFQFDDCEDVLIRDLTLRNMPSWTIHLDGTREADVLGVDILGNKYIPNNDGIAITDSRNVHVSDCTVITCDDSIVLNGSSDREQACENVTVTNCTIESNACGIKFGSGTDGPMRNFTFQNVLITDTNRGLGIQHRDSGLLENVLFSDIVVRTRMVPGPWWGKAEPIYVTSVPRDEETELGTVRNVRFSNVVADCENGALVYGSEEATIENLVFENVRLDVSGSEYGHLVGGNFDLQPTGVETPIFAHDVPGLHCEGASGVRLRDLVVEWDDGERGDLPDYYSHGIQCIDVSDVTIDGFEGRQAHRDTKAAAIALRNTETVSILDSRARSGTGRFLETDSVRDCRRFLNNDLVGVDRVGIEMEDGFTVSGNVPPI